MDSPTCLRVAVNGRVKQSALLKAATAIVTTCASFLVIVVVMYLQLLPAILVRIHKTLILNGYI